MTTAVLRSAQAGAILTSALSRLTRILLLVAVALCLGAPTAGAAPAPPLDNSLATLWTTILQTPSAENPFLRRRLLRPRRHGCAVWGRRFQRDVHGRVRHQDIRRRVLSRVQHVPGRWAGAGCD